VCLLRFLGVMDPATPSTGQSDDSQAAKAASLIKRRIFSDWSTTSSGAESCQLWKQVRQFQ
jgi:hypothetical protein